MFSETIFINHGRHEMISMNGHEAQNGHRELSTESCESYSGSESGCLYRSHVTTEKSYSLERERLHHQGQADSREAVQEVACFVRSEIKWVFLKSVKVETITQRGKLERWCCSLNSEDWTLSSGEQAFNLRVCLCFSAYTDTWLQCSAKYFQFLTRYSSSQLRTVILSPLLVGFYFAPD